MSSFLQLEAGIKARLIAKQNCIPFLLDDDIVHNIITSLLFDGNVECPDNNDIKQLENKEEDSFVITSKSMLKKEYDCQVCLCSVGVSACQTNRLNQSVKMETGMDVLGNISEGEVSHNCYVVCEGNFLQFKELLKNVWAVLIGLDAECNAGITHLDIHMYVYFKGS